MAIKPIPFIALAVLPLFVCCGGGEAAKEEASKEAAAPPAAEAKSAAAAPASSTGSASISGKITFDGTAPAPEKVKLSADPKCVAMHKDGLERAPIKVK